MNYKDIRASDLLWFENKELRYKKETLVTLVPSEKYEKHWHLKFAWWKEKTPEFFNLVNAKENSIRIALDHLHKRIPPEAV